MLYPAWYASPPSHPPNLVTIASEYVDLYVDYLCNKSVESKFAAFSRGFLDVAGGPALDLFRPEELELLVIGNEVWQRPLLTLSPLRPPPCVVWVASSWPNPSPSLFSPTTHLRVPGFCVCRFLL